MKGIILILWLITPLTITFFLTSRMSVDKDSETLQKHHYQAFSQQTVVIPISFVIVGNGNLINFKKNFISRYFFFRLINEINYITHNLDTIGLDSSCLYNDWIEPANRLVAPPRLPILFKLRNVIVIEDSVLSDVSNFNSCGAALHATYRQRVINKIPNYDSASLYIFITGSSCWEHKIMMGTVPSHCKRKYNNGTSYRMCAMGPPSTPIPIHIMVGALRLHYQHNKPSFRRMAGSLIHEIFHWAGLGHTKCPNGIMNPSGKAKRRFLNVKEQEKILQTMLTNKAWQLVTNKIKCE